MRDFEIRERLRLSVLKKYLDDSGSKVVEELSLPTTKARVDMAVINGHLHAFEIKGAGDTLARLPNQLLAYGKVFDFVTVVTEQKYASKILEMAESFVGVIACNTNETVYLRRPSKNTGKDAFSIAQLLWNVELLELLATHDIPHRRKDRSWKLCESLSRGLPIEQLSLEVRKRLKVRADWKVKVSSSIQQCDDSAIS